LDIGVLGYIGIVWPKEHSPEVWSVPPVTPCIYEGRNTQHFWHALWRCKFEFENWQLWTFSVVFLSPSRQYRHTAASLQISSTYFSFIPFILHSLVRSFVAVNASLDCALQFYKCNH